MSKAQAVAFGIYVAATSVNIDSKSNCLSLAHSCCLQFIESETTSQPLFGVVLESRTSYYWLKLIFGGRGNSLCLLYPVLVPAEFTGRLVEPSLHTPRPVLVEVVVGDDIVVPNSHLLFSGLDL